MQVKNELGRDAVILHTRRFRAGGIWGFFSREKVEVMAAVDSSLTKPGDTKRPLLPSQPASDTKVLALQGELASMRQMIEQVLIKLPDQAVKTSPLLQLLLKNDVDLSVANDLLTGFTEAQLLSAQDSGTVRHLLYERIAPYFRSIEGIQLDPVKCRTVALIGPTGVGKTTTVAKLAADFALKQGCKVALITADTYRIAAVEQLKTYADIMGLSLDIGYSPHDLQMSIRQHQDKNLILVDTAGRSPDNTSQLTELKALLAVDPLIETYLVLSTTTKYNDALKIIDKFSLCSPQKMLFTKVDESANIGVLFNLLYRFPLALSYITNGQNVPDDIELANPDQLINLLLKD